MGKIFSGFKTEIINDMVNGIINGTSNYYAVASNPVEVDSIEDVNNDIYSSAFLPMHKLLFGKKLKSVNIIPMTKNIEWAANTVYEKFNNNEDMTDLEYFVLTPPSEVGGYYHVFKCIDAPANGAGSTQIPDVLQLNSFTKSDGYTWRYLYSISTTNYDRFATDDYIPVYSNNVVKDNAFENSGVEVINITNSGNGYQTYHSGIISSVASDTILQISNTASTIDGFYTNNSIYIYNLTTPTAQLKTISNYVSNVSGKWVVLSESVNTDIILTGVTEYSIAPRVNFETDAVIVPKAYTTINATSNSINSIVIIDSGSELTWANASIVSNPSFGNGALLECIVPPPGGHGKVTTHELPIVGVGISFSFANSESNTVSTDVLYNSIGIIKSPYSLNANNTKGSEYTAISFNQLLKANTSPSTVYDIGTTITGNTSNAKAIVAFANSSELHLVGDKHFSNGEYIYDSSNTSCIININTLGDIYTKDITPLYIENIDNIQRVYNQTETFKIIISFFDAT